MQKIDREEKHRIYTAPLESQFEGVGYDTVFSVKKHILKSEYAEDYERVLKVAIAYSDEAEVLIMPEIHASETEIRQRLGIPTKNKNPDLKVGEQWVDVKSPLSRDKIVTNANKASSQGAIVCFTDDFIDFRNMENIAKNVLAHDEYHFDEVHFYSGGALYKYNSQGLILG